MAGLDYKVKNACQVVLSALERSSDVPLIVNFSGGKDSAVLLDLVRSVTGRCICFSCVSGLEFPDVAGMVQRTADSLGVELMWSYPDDYKGDFFQRLEQLKHFPTIISRWCSRDLKWRPQKKALTRRFGSHQFFKLNAVRRYESSRRNKIYQKQEFFRPDPDVSGDMMVYPIIDWTDEERDEYISVNGLKVETNPLYEKYSVSGCIWCPFYQASIYKRILSFEPDMYDRFIEWEGKLCQPSVIGYVYLRDLKAERIKEG
jgi:3'-phosphoadenosine 5'-phosphosulfate sulfotransferase (PAPS reductase)/FAD synthetase